MLKLKGEMVQNNYLTKISGWCMIDLVMHDFSLIIFHSSFEGFRKKDRMYRFFYHFFKNRSFFPTPSNYQKLKNKNYTREDLPYTNLLICCKNKFCPTSPFNFRVSPRHSKYKCFRGKYKFSFFHQFVIINANISYLIGLVLHMVKCLFLFDIPCLT